jgi:hypothetical protein
VPIQGRARVESSVGGEQYLKLVRSTPNKFQCPITHPTSMAHALDRVFLDSFIPKREMPDTNGEGRTPRLFLFFDATNGAQVAHK